MFANIPYVEDGESEQKLDVYIPNAAEDSTPVILAVHGGGGDKADFLKFAIHFTAQGYAVISINYRALPRYTYPAPVNDTYCALAWIYANADKYHFDTKQIAAVGHSLGGTLVATLGTVDDLKPYTENCFETSVDDDSIQAVITFTGIFDYTTSTNNLQAYFTDFFSTPLDEAPDLWAFASPITWVDPDDPPFLLVHGEADENIPPSYSTDFAAALDAVGVSNELLIIQNGTHFTIINSEEAYQAITEFLQAELKP